MKPGSLKSIIYTGPSMNPTLRSGDGLQIIPYNGKKIRSGDVIVFNSPEDGRKITHRVVSINSAGIKTRGDNNKNIDPWLLSSEKIIGRVVYAQRGKRRRTIFGGMIGQSYSVTYRVARKFSSAISPLLRPPYHWLAQAGFIKRWLKIWTKLQILSLKRPAGQELQLLLGPHVIGRLLPGRVQWNIRRPFRLIVDEESLPINELRDK